VRKFDPNNSKMRNKYNPWLEFVREKFETGNGCEDVVEPAWSRKAHVTLRTWMNDYIATEGLVTWTRRLNWSEDEVIDYNIFVRSMGSNGHWCSEVSILKAYASDIAIFKALIIAEEVTDRVPVHKEDLSPDELRPEGFSSLDQDLDNVTVEAAAEDVVAVEATKVRDAESFGDMGGDGTNDL
jgi:hypothetical protein